MPKRYKNFSKEHPVLDKLLHAYGTGIAVVITVLAAGVLLATFTMTPYELITKQVEHYVIEEEPLIDPAKITLPMATIGLAVLAFFVTCLIALWCERIFRRTDKSSHEHKSADGMED